jgi:hypothetical protein
MHDHTPNVKGVRKVESEYNLDFAVTRGRFDHHFRANSFSREGEAQGHMSGRLNLMHYD